MSLYFVMNVHIVCPHALNVKIKRSLKKFFIVSIYTHIMEPCRKISIQTSSSLS